MHDIPRFGYSTANSPSSIFGILHNMGHDIKLEFLMRKEFIFKLQRHTISMIRCQEASFSNFYQGWFHICPAGTLMSRTFGIDRIIL